MKTDINYDATADYIYTRLGGDMDRVVPAYQAFLRFASHFPEEQRQLSHVDTGMFDARILRHRVEYFQWKRSQAREARRAAKTATKLPLPVDPTEDTFGEDPIFGGSAAPSAHSVLTHSLSDQLKQMVNEVQVRLPNLDFEEDSSDDESEPEIFFSGLDWKTIKLPGDEGFSWDAEPEKEILQVEAKPEIKEKEKEKEKEKPVVSSRALASKLLPSDVLPTEGSLSKLRSELAKLSDSERFCQTLDDSHLSEGDFALMKRAINPKRPKRPSDMAYDDDGFPLLTTDLPAAKECPPPSGVLPKSFFTEFPDDLRACESRIEEVAVEEVEVAMEMDAEEEQCQAKVQAPASRPGRWTVIEHSDDSTSEEEAAVPQRGAKGGKGKGGKGAPLDRHGAGHRGVYA